MWADYAGKTNLVMGGSGFWASDISPTSGKTRVAGG